jgi:hypothetical protein
VLALPRRLLLLLRVVLLVLAPWPSCFPSLPCCWVVGPLAGTTPPAWGAMPGGGAHVTPRGTPCAAGAAGGAEGARGAGNDLQPGCDGAMCCCLATTWV